MINKKMSLGIDISNDWISYAVVSHGKSGVKLMSYGKSKTPHGAIKDGNISDSVILGKALKKLISRKKYRKCRSTVSLTIKPSLAQIIEMPEEMPGNIANFVRSEIRHSAFLAGKDMLMDYCRFGSASAKTHRLFVSAIEKNKINPLLKTLANADIEPDTIELPLAAWMRSIYQKHIKPRFKSNVLLVSIKDEVLNFCVFKNAGFDFVRRVDISGMDNESALEKCKTEINAIVQYYDIEFGGEEEIHWDCVMELPFDNQIPSEIQNSFIESVGMNVHLCTDSSILFDTSVISNEKDINVSLTSIGLALNPLEVSSPGIKTNLLPGEIKDSRTVKRELHLFVNAAAGILAVVLIFAGFVTSQYAKAQETVKNRKDKTPVKLVESLVAKRKNIDQQFELLSEKKQCLDEIMKKTVSIDWSEVLEEVRRNVPASLYITQVHNDQDFSLVIKGKALTADSVNLFSKCLGKSHLFESSNVKEIEREDKIKGVIDYTLKCTVADNRRIYAETD